MGVLSMSVTFCVPDEVSSHGLELQMSVSHQVGAGNLGPLDEQSALFTGEPSLQPCKMCISNKIHQCLHIMRKAIPQTLKAVRVCAFTH